jgi:hypothetical protein
MSAVRHPYVELVEPRLDAAARDWFRLRTAELGPKNFAASFAAVGRRAGTARVQLDAREATALEGATLPLPSGWPLAAVARAGWLGELATRLEAAEFHALVVGQFKTGDNGERLAILKALQLLPEPARFVDLAIEACRSHVQDVFEAIACENAYPARHFPEANFNQLVLKAFFTQVEVRRIAGLSERITPELVRMAHAYASERRAAGRTVPADLEVVTLAPIRAGSPNPTAPGASS